MRLALLPTTFLFAHAATTECLGDIKPVENIWKIESVSVFRDGHLKEPKSMLSVEFDLIRPYLDKCPPELNWMSRRDCQWALSNAGVHCVNEQYNNISGNPIGEMAPGRTWFNCTGRATMLLPGKWTKEDPEQAWLKWRIAKLDELAYEVPTTPQNISQVPFRSITIEVAYGQQ
jgi:hypothetical protein